MAFDIRQFENTAFEPRVDELELAGLQAFFPEGEKPVFKVRGLNSAEIHKGREQSTRGKTLTEIIIKLNGSEKEKAEGLLEAMGITPKDPASLILEYSNVEFGLVEPKMERQHVVRFAKAFPIEFGLMHRKIMDLTGRGHTAQVKP